MKRHDRAELCTSCSESSLLVRNHAVEGLWAVIEDSETNLGAAGGFDGLYKGRNDRCQ